MGNQSSSGMPYTHGFHVVKVKANSPGQVAGLIPYFDYIVSANDYLLNQQNNAFVQILQDNIDKPVKCVVYNSKSEKTREVNIIPNSAWDENKKELLGVSIRFCNIKSSTEYVWHILEVFPNSPASNSGLQQYTDYVVGSTSLVFQSSEDFFNLVSSNMGKALDFFVYNSERDDIRLVTLTPNKNWGGQGSLGCNVAYGLLHKIPTTENENTTIVDIPEPESLPSAVTSAPNTQENKPVLQQQERKQEEFSADLPRPVEITPKVISPPEPNILPTIPPSQTTNLPSTYAMSVPNTQATAQNTTLPPSSSHGNVAQPMDLEALKQKQAQLQMQLQKLRTQMN